MTKLYAENIWHVSRIFYLRCPGNRGFQIKYMEFMSWSFTAKNYDFWRLKWFVNEKLFNSTLKIKPQRVNFGRPDLLKVLHPNEY